MNSVANTEYYEEAFDILENSEGEILVAVSCLGGVVDNPMMYYDGKDKLVFCKCKDRFIILPNINEDIRNQLLSVKELLLVEIKEETDFEEYLVPLLKVNSIDDFIENLKS